MIFHAKFQTTVINHGFFFFFFFSCLGIPSRPRKLKVVINPRSKKGEARLVYLKKVAPLFEKAGIRADLMSKLFVVVAHNYSANSKKCVTSCMCLMSTCIVCDSYNKPHQIVCKLIIKNTLIY